MFYLLLIHENTHSFHDNLYQLWRLAESLDLRYVILVQGIQSLQQTKIKNKYTSTSL